MPSGASFTGSTQPATATARRRLCYVHDQPRCTLFELCTHFVLSVGIASRRSVPWVDAVVQLVFWHVHVGVGVAVAGKPRRDLLSALCCDTSERYGRTMPDVSSRMALHAACSMLVSSASAALRCMRWPTRHRQLMAGCAGGPHSYTALTAARAHTATVNLRRRKGAAHSGLRCQGAPPCAAREVYACTHARVPAFADPAACPAAAAGMP